MNIRNLLLCGLFVWAMSLNAQQTDLVRNNLKGNVRSVKETAYKVVEEKGAIEKGKAVYTLVNQFNEKGFKEADIKLGADNRQVMKTEYKYDTIGRLKQCLMYDSANSVVRHIDYKLNAKGERIENQSFTSENRLERKDTYTYDSKSRLIEERSFNPDNLLMNKITYSYDAGGRLIEQNKYSSSNELEKSWSFHYDYRDNVIDEETSSYDGSSAVLNYHYEYDSKGNWTKKVVMQDQRPVMIYERVIRY